ncbi:MAG: sugar phosphate isomerase/epimerase [Deltaproteobacteria bacterium]|nr:sugar phosphate isomerase/epimerase [Deltaproteobacteria bacterium]
MSNIINRLQVNIPFGLLRQGYLDLFLKHHLNPEIGLDATVLDNVSLSEFSAIATLLNAHKLTVTLHAPFIDLSPGSPDSSIQAATRQRFDQVLRLLPLFQPKAVVCHLGYEKRRYSFMKDTWVETSCCLWRWLGNRIAEEGGRLMLENVYEDDPADIKIIFQELAKTNIGFCFDVGHQAVFSAVPLADWIEVLGPYIGELHLHDNHGAEDEHLSLGHGTIDFPLILNYLRSRKPTPPLLTLEPHKEDHLWPSLIYLDKMWPWKED